MKQRTVRNLQDVAPATAQIQESLSQAIRFLQAQQLAQGEFQTIAATNTALTENSHADSSLFVTALVLYAIGSSDDARVPLLIERGLDFLASEMKGTGLWSYWSAHNTTAVSLPPDLDDTCCIAYLMTRYARPFPSNQALVLANRSAHGIFYTWLAVRPHQPRALMKKIRRVSDADIELVLSLSGTLDNIDCAVNANVLLYLGDIAETRAAQAFVVETVLKNLAPARSTYYVHPFSFFYLLSRAYANRVVSLAQARAAIVRAIESIANDDGSCGNALLTALAACTLLNFQVKSPVLERAIRNLSACQNADGSWARHAMFLGPAPYYGSEELTTALCVEALSKYRFLW